MEQLQSTAQLVFRCYKPMDESLSTKARVELQTESPWAEWMEQLKQEDARLAVQPIEEKATLVPRKPNWDIKRDAEKKTGKLDKATQRAIADIIKRKIAAGQVSAGAVATSAGAGAGAGLASSAGASHRASAGASGVASLEERAEGLDAAALSRALEGMSKVGASGSHGGRAGARGAGTGTGREELDEGDVDAVGGRAGRGLHMSSTASSRPRRRYDSDEDEEG